MRTYHRSLGKTTLGNCQDGGRKSRSHSADRPDRSTYLDTEMTLQRAELSWERERVQRSDLRKAHLHLPLPLLLVSRAHFPANTHYQLVSLCRADNAKTYINDWILWQTWRHGQFMNSSDDNLLVDLRLLCFGAIPRIKYRLQYTVTSYKWPYQPYHDQYNNCWQ